MFYLKVTLTFSARDLLVTMIFAMIAPFYFYFFDDSARSMLSAFGGYQD